VKKFPVAFLLSLQILAFAPNVAWAEDLETLSQQAYTAQQAQRYAQAEALWNKAIAIAPEQAILYYNLGVSLYSQKRFDEAIAAYQQAIQRDAKSTESHLA
jgi:tetratricopeptide (TPR) repeat protein